MQPTPRREDGPRAMTSVRGEPSEASCRQGGLLTGHLYRVLGLAIKEVQQLSRDRLLLAFLILGPLIELVLMGTLTAGGVANLPVAVVDQDRTRESRELVAKLHRQDELRVEAHGDSVDQAQEWMQNGDIAAIAVVPPGYAEVLTGEGQSAQIQIIADGSNQVISTVALGTAEDVAAEIARDLSASNAGARSGPLDLRFMRRFNPAGEDQPHAITAMLGIIVFEVALVVAAQSIARERERGTLEQLRVTPLGRFDLMIGKALPTLIIGLLDFLMMVGISVAWFDIPLRGSLLLLAVVTIPFILVQIGWGTLISLISRTQQQAMLLVFALAMVEVAFSGFLVPAGDMPGVMRIISYVSSVQHYLVVVRGIMLRGTGLGPLWLQGLALVGLSLSVMSLAWLRLRAGLDSDSLRQRLVAAWRRVRRWRERRRATREPGKAGIKRRGWGRGTA